MRIRDISADHFLKINQFFSLFARNRTINPQECNYHLNAHKLATRDSIITMLEKSVLAELDG